MAGSCCHHDHHREVHDRRFRQVLWIALAINAGMFAVELVAGVLASSLSLQADALDFFGDAANYAVSLVVVGMGLRWRASAAVAKGLTMTVFGLWLMGATVWHVIAGTVPDAATMGIVGFLALAANAAVFVMLWAFRGGDSNMRSAWLCSRNDVVGNVAVLLAALGVFGTGTGWPDLAVAVIMAGLALQGGVLTLRLASREFAADRALRQPAV